MKKLGILTLLLSLFGSGIANAQVLSMQNYLDLIAESNNELISIQSNIDAAKGKLAEINRVYSYYLNAGTQYANDQAGRPFLQVPRLDRTTAFLYNLSVNKQFETGTRLSIGFDGQYTKVAFPGNAIEYSDISPYIRLEQSLLKNFKGTVTNTSIAKQKANIRSIIYMLEYKKQAILLNAKLAYWNLSYARTVVDFRKTSLERTNKILSWTERRYNLDLAEKSDMLQIQAAVKLRELNLKLANESELKARRTFNQFLNITHDTVQYEVEKFVESGTAFEKDKKLEKRASRADLLAALEDVQSAIYDQEISSLNLGSDLIFTGGLALNGIDYKFGKAVEKLGNESRPSFFLGLNYTVPLDFKLRKTINKGYDSAKLAAQKAADDIAVKEKNDWLQIVDNWNNSKSRLALAIEIQNIQQQRNQEDQKLLRRGRTVTYLVLQSEQDLDDATLSVFQNILELISIYEQAEAFYGKNIEINLDNIE